MTLCLKPTPYKSQKRGSGKYPRGIALLPRVPNQRTEWFPAFVRCGSLMADNLSFTHAH